MNIGNVQFNDTDKLTLDDFSDDDNEILNENINDDIDPFGANSIENIKIHLRIQQRTGKKSITTIEGLYDIDFKEELKKMKKKFSCNGKIVSDDEDHGTVIQLQGDQRLEIRNYLMEKYKYKVDDIVIHGY
jgi:translation initiation factor 1